MSFTPTKISDLLSQIISKAVKCQRFASYTCTVSTLLLCSRISLMALFKTSTCFYNVKFPSVPAEFQYFDYLKFTYNVDLCITAPFVFLSVIFCQLWHVRNSSLLIKPFFACGPFSKHTETCGPIIHFSQFYRQPQRSRRCKFQECCPYKINNKSSRRFSNFTQ